MAPPASKVKRTRVVGSDPIPLETLTSVVGDTTAEDRVDGISGRGDASRFRKRSKSSEPLPFGTLDWCCIIARFAPLWEAAEGLERDESGVLRGRPRETNAAAILLFEVVNWETKSARRTERELRSAVVWGAVRDAAAEAWPNHPSRRMPSRAPSRKQRHYFRETVLGTDEAVEGLRAELRVVMQEIATAMGMFDSSSGSATEIDSARMLCGDATWIPAMFNTPGDVQLIDRETGEIFHRRRDPDAIPFHHGDRVVGRLLVTALARNPHGHEGLIIDLDFKPKVGQSDATVFTDMALRIAGDVPVAGVVYDMAMRAADIERSQRAGLVAVCKVPRTSSGRVNTRPIGAHRFRLVDGSTKQIDVVAADGCPGIVIATDEGRKWTPLLGGQVLKRSRHRGDAVAISRYWHVPDHPEVEPALRNARAIVRHTSTSDETTEGRLRADALRVFPENDRQFGRLFGIREFTESMHHHMKERLHGERARSVGLRRQRIDMHGYQLRLAIGALIAWCSRTGGDVSRWFGAWRPPPLKLT